MHWALRWATFMFNPGGHALQQVVGRRGIPSSMVESQLSAEAFATVPVCAAVVAAIIGGIIVRRRFDRQTAVCAIPLLTISGYNVALAILAVAGFIR